MDLSYYKELLDGLDNSNGVENTEDVIQRIVLMNNENITFTVEDKTIKKSISIEDILVQGDKNSRKIHFIMTRYFDGVDLSGKDIFVNYKNAKSETGYENIINFTKTDKLMEFDWLINGEITALSGDVSIQIEICEYDEVGDIIYRYQTVPCGLHVERTVISNGDAQPSDYYLDIKFLKEHTTPVIYEDMSSLSTPISIDGRNIVMPSLEDIAVTQDSRSKILTFKIKRYVDNIDLATKTTCIKFKIPDGTGDRSFVCNYEATATHIKFDWLLDSKVTQFEGKVEFAIEFIGYNEKNEFYCYNTFPEYIFIKKGLNVDGIIEQPSVSWIQSWNILADSYLRDYLKYLEQVKESTAKAIASASESLLAMQKAKASEVSAQNNAGIAWQQADRAERMANLTNGYKVVVENTMNQFNTKYNKFVSEYENIRKKDEKITKGDLSEVLSGIIDGKADIGHTHLATDIIQDSTHKFVTDAQLSDLSKARIKTIPIKESDLDSALATKINNGGSGGGTGGIVVSGAQIDDITPSYSKVYSSQTTENKISTAVGSAISGLDGLSDNNFTNAEKQKLARIEDDANYFTLTTISASIVNETTNKRFTSPTEKEGFADKYTKAEIDNMMSSLTSGMVWKQDVVSFADIAIKYPNPIKDWAVSTASGETYLYDGEAWIKIGSGKTPLATKTTNGLMSSLDKTKLDGVETNANNYAHPSKHSAEMIDPTNDRQFVTTAQKQKIDGLNTIIADSLTPYRKTSTKILESDLDQDFIDKLSNAGGTIINDEVSSLSQTYSSAVIDAKIKVVVDDVATALDIDALFM